MTRFLRRAIILMLPAVLLFAQHSALAHVISHLDAGQAPASEKTLVHLKLCGKCLSAEKLAHAAPAQCARMGVAHGGYLPPRATAYAFTSQHSATYRSRAPPQFL